MGQITDGVIDAAEVVAGKAVARAVPTLVGLPQGGAMGLAVQVGAALLAGFIGRQISANAGKMMLAGGLAAPVESFVKGANIPLISAALADDEFYAPGALAVGAYPMLPGVSAYPQYGEDDDAEVVYGQ